MGRELSVSLWAALGLRGGVERGDLLAQRTQNYWLFKSEPNLRHSLIFTTKPHIQEIIFALAKCRKLVLMSKSNFTASKIKMNVVTFFVKNICTKKSTV